MLPARATEGWGAGRVQPDFHGRRTGVSRFQEVAAVCRHHGSGTRVFTGLMPSRGMRSGRWMSPWRKPTPAKYYVSTPRVRNIKAVLPIGLTPNDPMGGLGGPARAPLPTTSCVLRSQPDRHTPRHFWKILPTTHNFIPSAQQPIPEASGCKKVYLPTTIISSAGNESSLTGPSFVTRMSYSRRAPPTRCSPSQLS